MDNKILEILSDIEKTAHKYEWEFEISNLFKNALERATEIDDKETKQKLLWEFLLFRFTVKTDLTEKSPKRFHPVMTGHNDKGGYVEFPDKSNLNKESIKYFEQRVMETKNNELKSRYTDYLWEREKKAEYAEIATRSYLDSLSLFYESTWFFRLADALNRLVYFSLIQAVDENTTIFIRDTLLKYLRKMVADQKYRFCLELIETFCYLQNRSTQNNQEVMQIATQCVEYFRKENNFHLERSFLEARKQLYKINNEPIRDQDQLIAESYTAEAGIHESKGDNLVASSYYEQALKKYQQLGDKKNIDLMQGKFIGSNKKSLSEFRTVSTEIKIPQEAFDKIIATPLSASDLKGALQRLSVMDLLLPDYESIERQTKKMEKDYPLQFLVSQKVIDAEGNSVDSGENPFQHMLMRNAMIFIGISENVINKIFDRLAGEKGLNAKSLFAFLENWSLLPMKNRVIIQSGIEKHFQNDFISSLHILTPQLEATIRSLLQIAGLKTISFIRNTTSTQASALSNLLEKEEAPRVLGSNLTWYLKILLTEKLGYNLRNEVAHGLIDPEKCNKSNSSFLLFIFLLLTRFQKTTN